jgi:hypothetical protein
MDRQERRRGLPRSRTFAGFVLLLAVVLWTPAVSAAAAARLQDPVSRIELGPMGYEGLQPDYLIAGSPMLTVDFVDDTHLLVTFEVRRLMKRETRVEPGEADRTVMACLIEISSGNVLARAEWRLHDRSQYLWNLGGGRFLLRVRDELSVFGPMAGKPEDAFRLSPFLVTERHVVAVLVSADRDLLTIESVKRPDAAVGDIAVHVGADSMPVQVNFYRLKTDDADQKLAAVSAGAIRTRTAVALPMTTAGYLDILEGGKSTWLFNFDEHAGKVDELLAFATTCFPRPVFVSHSEFVVFGCKGGDERRMFAGFNLRGEEMWQQGFYESYVAPTFSFAPAAGRFALGRTLVPVPMGDNFSLSSASVNSQDVRVYQAHDGRMLFRIDCSPVEPAGHNFDLSPDGLKVAVVREIEVHHKGTKDTPPYTGKSAGVEIYALPPLTDQEQSEVKATAINAPADTGVPIDVALARLAASKSKASAKGEVGTIAPAENPPEPAPANPPTEMNSDSAGEQASQLGDVPNETQPGEPRKPPTLYGPDEKPEHK